MYVYIHHYHAGSCETKNVGVGALHYLLPSAGETKILYDRWTKLKIHIYIYLKEKKLRNVLRLEGYLVILPMTTMNKKCYKTKLCMMKS
jgi:hypothetical protein